MPQELPRNQKGSLRHVHRSSSCRRAGAVAANHGRSCQKSTLRQSVSQVTLLWKERCQRGTCEYSQLCGELHKCRKVQDGPKKVRYQYCARIFAAVKGSKVFRIFLRIDHANMARNTAWGCIQLTDARGAENKGLSCVSCLGSSTIGATHVPRRRVRCGNKGLSCVSLVLAPVLHLFEHRGHSHYDSQ